MICKHYKTCGGCFFWPEEYSEELKQKEKIIKKEFSYVQTDVFPIIASPKTVHYRNKMEFTFRENLAKERYLGLIAKKNRVLNLDECRISPEWFLVAKHIIFNWWEKENIEAYFAPKNVGVLRYLTLREGARTGQKMIILTIAGQEEFFWEQSLLDALSHLLAENDTLILRKQFIQKKVPTRFEEKILFGKGFIEEQLQMRDGAFLTFSIKPSSFFQPNTWQAERLYSRALELADLNKQDIVYDLYCGTGTIGIFASRSVKFVCGIEVNKDAVSDAEENIKNNHIDNMKVFAQEVEGISFEEKPSCIIVDPPRVGLSEKAINQILSLQSCKIIYISCNPVSQAQNVKKFIENGYFIKAIQPVDQFPHTPHVENIVVLVSSL